LGPRVFMAALLPLRRVRHDAKRVLASVGRWQVWDLPRLLRWYVLLISALALAVFGVAAANTPVQFRQIAVFLALLACGVVSTEATRQVKEPQGSVARDLQPVWYLAIAIILPPAYALLAPVPLMVHKLWRRRRMLVYRRIFSHGTISLAYGAASFTFHSIPTAIAGTSPGAGVHALVWVAVVAACGVIGTVINTVLVFGAVFLSDPTARFRDLIGNRTSITTDLLEFSLAVSLTLVVAINPVLMALALPSVILSRRYLMQAQLVAQTRIDTKTGLLNAGTWRREATAEFYRALRHRTPLALIMVDVDHFSSVNETAGLEAGDQVLRGIASTLTENLQGAGLVGRFGGEEFAILLPEAGEAEARRLAERLRDHIAGEPIAIEDGSHAGFVFRLTVSIGIAILDHSRRALGELIGAADEALNEAKTTGRNRVCVVPGAVVEAN
jgi:diguanylate cyclase (GGDEF)-like protein